MRLSPLATLTLPATILATPLSSPTIRAGETVGLMPRTLEYCFIVNDDGDGGWGVKCRSSPSFSAAVKQTFNNGDLLAFTCYKSGDCYRKNCSWDYAVDYKCYINGYYTDDDCTTKNLGKC